MQKWNEIRGCSLLLQPKTCSKSMNNYLQEQKLFSYHIYNCFKFERKQNFVFFFFNLCHFELKSAPTQDKFLDFLQNTFQKLKMLPVHTKPPANFGAILFGGDLCCKHGSKFRPKLAKRFGVVCPSAIRSIHWKKAFWKHFQLCKVFCKSQGIYLKSELISS